MSKRIDYSLRTPQFIATFKTQKKAAEYLGITPRSLRRYREETRRPTGEIARLINRRVHNKYRVHNAYGSIKIKFSNGFTYTSRSAVRGTTAEMEEEFRKAEREAEKARKSGERAGLRVVSHKAKVKWLPAMIKYKSLT